MLIALVGLAAVGALAGVPWLVSALLLPRWIRSARWPMADADRVVSQALHMVVPARDEVQTIGACAAALDAVEGDDISIVVVDDGSEDGTVARARAALGEGHRGAVVQAPERPVGWSGKAWACSVGAEAADRPDWYLFVDADVVVDPRLPGALIRLAGSEVDLVSAFGRWELPTVGVAWLMPALGWLIRGVVDPGAVRDGRVAFANGQVLLMRGTMYRRLGGHGVVKGDVLDDVGLARACLRAGGRSAIVWMPDGFVVHAYASIGDMMRGYRKNLVAGVGSSARTAQIGVAVLWAYTGPLVGLAASLALVALGWPAVGSVLAGICGVGLGLCIGVRLALDRLEGRSGMLAPLQPLAGIPLAWLFGTSALSRRAVWKGRSFDRGVAE